MIGGVDGEAALIGRDRELRAVRDFVAAGHGPAAVVLEGPAGIGKTTVWWAGVREAREHGLRVLVARPLESDASVSLLGLSDLVGDLVEDLCYRLPEPQQRALRTAVLRHEAGGEAVDALALNAAVLGVLRAGAAKGPLLLSIDDAQWLDRASADALRHAARHLVDEDVRLLVTRRDAPAGSPHAELGLARERVEVLRIGAMELDDVRELVTRELGRALPLPTLRRIAELSGGNPFYVLELARAGATDGEDLIAALSHERGLERLVGERLAILPEATLDALGAVAALARPTGAAVTALLGDAAALDPAFRAGVLEEDGPRVRFSHPLLAAGAYNSLPPRRRREVHALLAKAAADPEERAHHLASSTIEPSQDVAAAIAAGADAAERRGAPAAAAELLERAAELTPAVDSDAASRRRLQAAGDHARAGDKGRADEAFRRLVAELRPGPLRAEALSWLAKMGRGSVVQAAAFGRQAVQESADDPELRARCLLSLANVLMVNNDWRGAHEAAQDAVDIARAGAGEDTLMAALGVAGEFEGFRWPGRGRDLLGEAMALGGERLIPDAYDCPAAALGRLHLWCDELDEARALLAGTRQRALDAGDEYGACGVGAHLAEVEVRAGNLARARQIVEAGLAVEEQGNADQELCYALYVRALVAAHEGEADFARQVAARALELAEQIEDAIAPTECSCVLGFLELSLGNGAAAVAHLEPLPALLDQIGISEPGVFLCHADLIEALIAVGRLDDAEAQLADWNALARDTDRPRLLATAARARGLLAAARGDQSVALEALEQATEHHERLPVPIERGRTLLALGSALRRSGRRRDARATLDEALELFEAIAARIWAERTRRELGRLGGRAPSGDELTPTEQKVAALVAEGHSNKEVAADLFVTVRTVESNLTRIYAKLGIRSRAELAAQGVPGERDAPG